MQAEKGYGYASSESSSESSGYESSSTEELPPVQVRRIRRGINKFRKGVKNLRVYTKHLGVAIKALYPKAEVPEYSPESFASAYSSSSGSGSSMSSSSKSSSSSSSSGGVSPKKSAKRSRTVHLQGHERGAASTGKTKLANNLTSWWCRYKKNKTERQLEELYEELNFRKGQLMTLDLKEKIMKFQSRLH
jgi:hypothetical protein